METISTPRNIDFTHNFADDLNQIRFDGPPYALARMGDGERMILRAQVGSGADGWISPGNTWLMASLWNVMSCDMKGFHIGISCRCCDKMSNQWYLKHIRTPESRMTYSNLFVNANFQDFRKMLGTKGITVGCHDECPIRVPKNVVNDPWDFHATVDEMVEYDDLMLVAAGPASAALIYEYWKRSPTQIIIDVGSAADFCITGNATRGYHLPDQPTSNKVCQW